jgi:hypothetical protein
MCGMVLANGIDKRLPYTDYIVVLGDGGIMEQGTFAELKALEGYVASLSLTDAAWKVKSAYDIADDESVTSEATALGDSTDGSDFISAAEEANRRTGDLTVYGYYFSAVGWWVFAIMLFLLGCFTVSSVMPGMNLLDPF